MALRARDLAVDAELLKAIPLPVRQVLEGLKPGELAVTDGAVFISNILYAPPSD